MSRTRAVGRALGRALTPAPPAGVMGTWAIVGGTIPHPAGAALTFRMRGQSSVAVVSLGDGAAEEGVSHETLNFAALRKLPLVFACENNLYATNTRIRDRQARPEIWTHAARFGIPGVQLHGDDVLAVHREARKAITRAAGPWPDTSSSSGRTGCSSIVESTRITSSARARRSRRSSIRARPTSRPRRSA